MRPRTNPNDHRARRRTLDPLRLRGDSDIAIGIRRKGLHGDKQQSRAGWTVGVQRSKRNGSRNRSRDQQEQHEPGDQDRHRRLSLDAQPGRPEKACPLSHDTTRVNERSTQGRSPHSPLPQPPIPLRRETLQVDSTRRASIHHTRSISPLTPVPLIHSKKTFKSTMRSGRLLEMTTLDRERPEIRREPSPNSDRHLKK